MVKNKLNKEYKFYKENKKELLKQYNNKYIALHNCEVITNADTNNEVIDYMLKNNYTLGEFLVHLVVKDEPLQKFSRNFF